MKEEKLYSFYKNKNILVPGGAGFIGSNLVRRLVGYGALVTIVDSFSKYCGANTFNLKQIKDKTILIRQKIESFISEHSLNEYDLIFNCVGLADHHIGLKHPELDYEINCYSGLKMLVALVGKKVSCKTIFLGSRSQYGRANSKVIQEDQPLKPLDIQSVHKTTLENYCNVYANHYRLNLAFLRLTNVYGPGQRLRGTGIGTVGEIIKNGITDKEIIIFGRPNRTKDVLFIDDVIDALLLLGRDNKKGFRVYNLGGQLCKMSALIASVKRKIKNVRVKLKPFPGKIKIMETGSIVLNVKKLKKATGWKPKVSIGKGIDKTFDYYRRYKNYYLYP